jgi:hypothetical protein
MSAAVVVRFAVLLAPVVLALSAWIAAWLFFRFSGESWRAPRYLEDGAVDAHDLLAK